jgi:hypothetical protein
MTLGGVVRLIIVGVVSRGSALRLGPLALGPQRANVVESRHGRVAVRVAVRLASKTGEVPPADTTYTVFEGAETCRSFFSFEPAAISPRARPGALLRLPNRPGRLLQRSDLVCVPRFVRDCCK